jgi:hypothetical protein
MRRRLLFGGGTGTVKAAVAARRPNNDRLLRHADFLPEQPAAASPSRGLFRPPRAGGKSRRGLFCAQTACGVPAGGCSGAERRETEMTEKRWAEEQRPADRPVMIWENQRGGAAKTHPCSGAKLGRG